VGTPEVGLDVQADVPLASGFARAEVVAVSRKRGHHFSKQPQLSIQLLAGLGVEGDGHLGTTVQHVYDKRKDPSRPNLRQVHVLQAELFDELRLNGFHLQPGDLGENITTCGLDLLCLPVGTQLHLGASAIVEITGLRSPCVQMDRFLPGLMAATLDRDEEGRLVRKSGVMSIVVEGGTVSAGDAIRVVLPEEPHRSLEPV
jgi:MOSC domain-containing protein YiiM